MDCVAEQRAVSRGGVAVEAVHQWGQTVRRKSVSAIVFTEFATVAGRGYEQRELRTGVVAAAKSMGVSVCV